MLHSVVLAAGVSCRRLHGVPGDDVDYSEVESYATVSTLLDVELLDRAS